MIVQVRVRVVLKGKLLILLGSHHLLIYVMPWRTWENDKYLLDSLRLLELIQESKSLMRMGIQLPESAIDVLKQVGLDICCVLFDMTDVLVSLFLLSCVCYNRLFPSYLVPLFQNESV